MKVCRKHVQEERGTEGRDKNNTYYWKLSYTRKLAKKFHSPRTVRVCADAQSRPHEKYLPCTRSIDHHGEMIMKFIFETQDNTETQLFLLDNNHSSNELWTITVSDILVSGVTRVHESRHQLSWYINDAFRSDTVSPFPYQRNMLRKRLVSVLHLWECRPWAPSGRPLLYPLCLLWITTDYCIHGLWASILTGSKWIYLGSELCWNCKTPFSEIM